MLVFVVRATFMVACLVACWIGGIELLLRCVRLARRMFVMCLVQTVDR